jgi:RNA polymerase sigma factor (TIGR02999 family)
LPRDVTLILDDLVSGRSDAASELLPIVYAELRAVAAAQMARLRPGQTLQPTALVHEAYLKLVRGRDPGWQGRGHFFGAAAQAMREIIVDHVRRKAAAKRGGGRLADPGDLEAAAAGLAPAEGGGGAEEVLAVHAAVDALRAVHGRRADVVVMRFFGGFTVEEIAEAQGTTARTVDRDLRFARAFLYDHINNDDGAAARGGDDNARGGDPAAPGSA